MRAMTDAKRTNMTFDDQDKLHMEAVRKAWNIKSKIGAVRYALTLAYYVAIGEARLVDKNGKPFRIIPTR